MNPIQTVLADDPWWLIVGKAVALFVVGVVMTLLSIWAERRVIGRMQQRLGPNRNGPFGLLQTLADGIKLGLKEDILPAAAHKAVYIVAPALSVIPAFMAFAVIPFGPEVSIFGERTALQLVDYNVGVLYILAIASIGVYGIVLAGWSSGSTYPLLGGIRSTAQVISYEVAMGLSFVAVFLWAGSMSTSEIVAQQDRFWFAFALFPSFAIYVVSMVGETNRAPFDLAEAEGELVGGFHTEYASLKFALFYLAEYVNMVTVSSLATTLFLGGWRAPWPISQIGEDAAHPDGLFNTGWWPLIWFFGKVIACLFAFVWLRGSLPRLRYDQFMDLGWKVLIPVAIGWLLLVATVRTLTDELDVSRSQYLIGAAVVLGVLAAITFLVPAGDDPTDEADEAAPFDPMAGGYPVPPMPGQTVPGAPQQLIPTGARPAVDASDSKEEPDA